ncbi:MAG: hypothetical protein RIQ78_714 [Bacteroidota bacterium]|jgi:uncharacterized protein (DUF697 family)/predicted flap endonuclease-1-like 5' DNA nuclease
MNTITSNTITSRREANRITLRRTLYATGAGLIPVPVLDAAAILTIQILMTRDIARAYGTPFSQSRAKSIITVLVGDVATGGLIKFIPGVGTFLGSGATAVAGAASTYALGRVFSQHFSQGGTLLNFDPVQSRAFFQAEFEKGTEIVAGMSDSASNTLTARKQDIQSDINALRATLPTYFPISSPTPAAPVVNIADLQIVEGIGAKVASVLKKGGITNLVELSEASSEQLESILESAGSHFNMMVPDSWPEQAALAVSGDWAALKALQDRLTGGK